MIKGKRRYTKMTINGAGGTKAGEYCAKCDDIIVFYEPSPDELEGKAYRKYVHEQLRITGGDLINGKPYCAKCAEDEHWRRLRTAIDTIHSAKNHERRGLWKRVGSYSERNADGEVVLEYINVCCTSCLRYATWDAIMLPKGYPYCPNCKATMDMEE